MKKRRGRKSSPLEDIRPARWQSKVTEELLNLIWIIEETLSIDTKLESILADIVAGPCFIESELPNPSDGECDGPPINRLKVVAQKTLIMKNNFLKC